MRKIKDNKGRTSVGDDIWDPYAVTAEGVDNNGHYWYSDCDNYGNPVEHPKETHPYNYSPYVNWQHQDSNIREKSNGSMYTDRLLQWDFAKHDDLCEKHFGNKGQRWIDRPPELIEAFVRDWLDDQTVTLTKVVEYCNPSNGYPVWNLVYHKEDKE